MFLICLNILVLSTSNRLAISSCDNQTVSFSLSVLTSNNEEEFKNAIENVKLDSEDDFMNEVFSMCNNLSKEKKKKMLEIIKASLDLSK